MKKGQPSGLKFHPKPGNLRLYSYSLQSFLILTPNPSTNPPVFHGWWSLFHTSSPILWIKHHGSTLPASSRHPVTHVSTEGVDIFTRSAVPEPHRLVERGGGEPTTIGGKGNLGGWGTMDLVGFHRMSSDLKQKGGLMGMITLTTYLVFHGD